MKNQDVEPAEEYRVDGEEIAGHDRGGLGGEKLAPRQARPARRRVEPSPVQDLPYGGGCHPVSQSGEFAVDAAVTPARILGREAAHQLSHYLGRGWSAWWLGGRVCPLAGDQFAVPAQERLGLHEEHRPTHPGQCSRQRGQYGQYGPVGWARSRTADLAA